jgi:hypothetical protein
VKGGIVRPIHWIEIANERIRQAKAQGWEAWQSGGMWIVNSPDEVYTGIGKTELWAFWDLFSDADVWDEIGEMLERDAKARGEG